MDILEKLTGQLDKVLKGAGQAAGAPELKAFSLDEFANWAAGEIEKAVDEGKEHPARATARLKGLQLSIAVAQAAFESASLEKFEIPIFSEKAATVIDLDDRFSAIEDKLDGFIAAVKGGDKDKADDKPDDKSKDESSDKSDDKPDDKSKGEGGDGKGKDKTDDKPDDKGKDKTDDEKAKAEKAAADAGNDPEFDEGDRDLWPLDLAKSIERSDAEKEIYDWGDDPQAVRENLG